MSYKLPSMEHEFEIQVKGNETGINWAGKFKYQRPSLSQRSMIDAFRAKLSGDLLTISDNVFELNEALAHLRFTLTSYPDWWKEADFGGSLYDYNVVMDIYQKIVEFEKEWRNKVHGGEAKDVQESNGNPAGATL
jgi:hypothetical protein